MLFTWPGQLPFALKYSLEGLCETVNRHPGMLQGSVSVNDVEDFQD